MSQRTFAQPKKAAFTSIPAQRQRATAPRDTTEALKFVNMALDKVPTNKKATKLKRKIRPRAISPGTPVQKR